MADIKIHDKYFVPYLSEKEIIDKVDKAKTKKIKGDFSLGCHRLSFCQTIEPLATQPYIHITPCQTSLVGPVADSVAPAWHASPAFG